MGSFFIVVTVVDVDVRFKTVVDVPLFTEIGSLDVVLEEEVRLGAMVVIVDVSADDEDEDDEDDEDMVF